MIRLCWEAGVIAWGLLDQHCWLLISETELSERRKRGAPRTASDPPADVHRTYRGLTPSSTAWAPSTPPSALRCAWRAWGRRSPVATCPRYA